MNEDWFSGTRTAWNKGPHQEPTKKDHGKITEDKGRRHQDKKPGKEVEYVFVYYKACGKV